MTFLDLESSPTDYHFLVGDEAQSAENLMECNISEVTEVTGVTASNDAPCSGHLSENTEVTGVTLLLTGAIDPNETPPEVMPDKVDIKRPCYVVYDDFVDYGKPGVYYHGIRIDRDGDATNTNDYICDPLHVEAGSCDASDSNYGLMLKFKNQRGLWKRWLMPMEMLAGGCEELRGMLLAQGLRIDHKQRNHLPNYLQSQRPKQRLECALKVGWHDDCFVLPDRVIGKRDDVFFQSDQATVAGYGSKGSTSDWRENIGKYCEGNPLLLFAVSVGFTGALLKKCHMGYAGFHIFGDSSTGKSTGHKIAASIWGGDEFRRTWKSTSNGLEAAAVLHNDCLLALDELGDSDAREVNQTVYALGNGTGKQRANVKGTARHVHKWRVVLLSNGEKTLESHLQEKGLSVKAGQSIRLLQVPVFGKYGVMV